MEFTIIAAEDLTHGQFRRLQELITAQFEGDDPANHVGDAHEIVISVSSYDPYPRTVRATWNSFMPEPEGVTGGPSEFHQVLIWRPFNNSSNPATKADWDLEVDG